MTFLVGFAVQDAYAPGTALDENASPIGPQFSTEDVNMGENPIVYENCVPSGGVNAWNIFAFSVADDFVLAEDTTITDVHFILWTIDGYDGAPIQFAILADDGGDPDPANILASGDAQNIGVEEIAPRPGFIRELVWFDLEDSVALSAGTTYWLWLHHGNGFSGTFAFWEFCQSGTIGEQLHQYFLSDFNGSPILRSPDAWFQLSSALIEVEIDIKPGSDPNAINLNKKKGSTPVAILGSASFDVTDIDVTTLTFGPGAALPKHDLTDGVVYASHLEDVNTDGETDLVVHFINPDTGILPGDTEACVDGALNDATPINGCDDIKTIPSS